MLDHCIYDIKLATELAIFSIKSNMKIIWCGNGGSAADVQHIAAELMGRLTTHNRKPIPSVALTTDSSFINAWSYHTGYDSIFSWQIQGLSQNGDALFAISAS